MELIDSIREIISIDTTPDGGTREIAKWIRNRCEELDLNFIEQDDSFNGVEQSNSIVSVKNENLFLNHLHANNTLEDFLLVSHLDTVDPGSGLMWTENQMNPFQLMIKDGFLHGLGVADGKVDFICKLEALKQVQQEINSNSKLKWIRKPLLLGTYGEEIGMHGMLRFIRKNKFKAKYALIGETTDLKLVYGTKGYAIVEMRIPFSESEKQYRQQHDLSESATSQTRMFNATNTYHEGGYWSSQENAIDKIFKYFLQLPDGIAIMEVDAGVSYNVFPLHGMVEFDVISGIQNSMIQKLKKLFYAITDLRGQFLQFCDLDYSPSQPQFKMTTLKSNEDELVISGLFLFPPLVRESDYQNWLKQIKDFLRHELNGDIRLVDYKKPYKLNKDSQFVGDCLNVFREAELEEKLSTLPKTNESSLLSRIGIECISFGAGIREGNTHSPHEKVKVDDLYKSIDFYTKAIKNFCCSEV